jgi:hypothetical protein
VIVEVVDDAAAVAALMPAAVASWSWATTAIGGGFLCIVLAASGGRGSSLLGAGCRDDGAALLDSGPPSYAWDVLEIGFWAEGGVGGASAPFFVAGLASGEGSPPSRIVVCEDGTTFRAG